MLRLPLAAVGIALLFAISAAQAQQAPSSPGNQPPAAQVDPASVGLPVYSSDGQKLGQITEVGTAGGQQAVRAEMKEFLGGGSASVVIDATILQKKANRMELAMTAAEVRTRS